MCVVCSQHCPPPTPPTKSFTISFCAHARANKHTHAHIINLRSGVLLLFSSFIIIFWSFLFVAQKKHCKHVSFVGNIFDFIHINWYCVCVDGCCCCFSVQFKTTEKNVNKNTGKNCCCVHCYVVVLCVCVSHCAFYMELRDCSSIFRPNALIANAHTHTHVRPQKSWQNSINFWSYWQQYNNNDFCFKLRSIRLCIKTTETALRCSWKLQLKLWRCAHLTQKRTRTEYGAKKRQWNEWAKKSTDKHFRGRRKKIPCRIVEFQKKREKNSIEIMWYAKDG